MLIIHYIFARLQSSICVKSTFLNNFVKNYYNAQTSNDNWKQ